MYQIFQKNKLKIGQYQNIVTCGDEKSQLKANTMLFKLCSQLFHIIEKLK